jgi:hypothetical protein
VLPQNKKVTTIVQIQKRERNDGGVFLLATGALFVDGRKIYQLTSFRVRISGSAAAPSQDGTRRSEQHAKDLSHLKISPVRYQFELDPSADKWLARSLSHVYRSGVTNDVYRKSVGGGARRLRVEAKPISEHLVEASLSVWRVSNRADLSRFDVLATCQARVGREYGSRPAALTPLKNGVVAHDFTAGKPDLYRSGELSRALLFSELTIFCAADPGYGT